MKGPDGFCYLNHILLQEELTHNNDVVTMGEMGWTRRTQIDESYGYIRIYVPESKAGSFPSRLRIFGGAIFIQRIRKRGQIVVCKKYYCFHATRTCTRISKFQRRGADGHDEPCDRMPKCLNYLIPHTSNDLSCPARLRCNNGVFIRPKGTQLKHIRAISRRE